MAQRNAFAGVGVGTGNNNAGVPADAGVSKKGVTGDSTVDTNIYVTKKEKKCLSVKSKCYNSKLTAETSDGVKLNCSSLGNNAFEWRYGDDEACEPNKGQCKPEVKCSADIKGSQANFKCTNDLPEECGNSIKENGEECDGNVGVGSCPAGTTGTTTCTNDCKIDKTNCQITAVCGNNQVETGETCDDGNTANGDGCDSSCKEEVKKSTIILGDYNGDGITDFGDVVKFNWHVAFGESLGNQKYTGDNCGGKNQKPCKIGNNNIYICDDGSGLSTTNTNKCNPGSNLGDYNGDGITNFGDVVKFNWHVAFGESLGNQKYAEDSCGGKNQKPCKILDNSIYICDDGSGLATDNSGTC